MATIKRISRQFLTLLIPPICGIFLLTAILIGVLQYWSLSSELAAKGVRTLTLSTIVLDGPLWSMDTLQVKQVLEALSNDNEVAAVVVQGTGHQLHYARNEKRIQPDLLVFKGDVIHHGIVDVKVGTASIYLTRAVMLAKIRTSLFLLGGTLLVLLLTLILLNRLIQQRIISRPLEKLVAGITRNAEEKTFDSIQIASRNEIGFLAASFNDMMRNLKAYSDNLQKMNEELEGRVELRTEQLSSTNEKLSKAMSELWGEMQLAKKIQKVLLPENPVIPGYDIVASMVPADEVGGDYYDVISVSGYDWIVVGDVSGHGVPAGLVMMMVQTAIHTVLLANPQTSTSTLLTIINQSIYMNIRRMDEQKHMTIVVMARGVDGGFTFAGLHEDILLWRTATGKVVKIGTNGMWIGLEPNISGMLQVDTLKMEIGDCMVLFTDGVIEARKNGQFFGDERLISAIEKTSHLSAADVHTSIRNAMADYQKLDDSVVLVIKRDS